MADSAGCSRTSSNVSASRISNSAPLQIWPHYTQHLVQAKRNSGNIYASAASRIRGRRYTSQRIDLGSQAASSDPLFYVIAPAIAQHRRPSAPCSNLTTIAPSSANTSVANSNAAPPEPHSQMIGCRVPGRGRTHIAKHKVDMSNTREPLAFQPREKITNQGITPRSPPNSSRSTATIRPSGPIRSAAT